MRKLTHQQLVSNMYRYYRVVIIDLYPLLRNYDVWGVIVGTNWNSKRRRMAERSGKTSVFLESSSWKRRRNPRKVLLGEYFAYLT